MRYRRDPVVLFLAATLAAIPLSPSLAETAPSSISPGETDRVVELPTACPTFSWGAVEGAAGYELAVLDLGRAEEPRVVLRHRIASAGLSWTPARGQCLPPGSSYGWTLQALDAAAEPLGGEEEWAAMRYFAVPGAPTAAEVAAALETLRRWQAAEEEETSASAGRHGLRRAASEAAAGTGTAAIRGENPGTGVDQHGIWGQTASSAGGALVGVNTAGGPDLVLDGTAQGEADTTLTQSGIDRPSASAQTFEVQNSGGGGITLQVAGAPVSLAGHGHAGEEIVAGTVADARIADSLARDAEVMPIVLANDGPGSGLDADTLDGAQGTSFQARVTGACPFGQAMQGINADGSVLCFDFPRVVAATTVDDTNAVGNHSSIVVGGDGLPIISYYDGNNSALKVARCNDAGCEGGDETATIVDNAAQVGWHTSIALGNDGFPVISYYDVSNTALKVAKCNDAACAGGDETVTTVDDSAAVGEYTSIAVANDGFPVVSYYDSTAGALRVAKCNDAACAGGDETITTVDDPVDAGAFSSLALGSDGFPVISYLDDGASALRVAKCNDAACAGGDETITIVDNAGAVGLYTSITLGSDGFPVVSYCDAGNTSLKVVKCNDAACAGGDETITTVDNAAAVGEHTSITIGGDGLPVLGYYDATNTALKVAKCNDAACAGGDETITTVDNAAGVGQSTSTALGGDGFPVISYYDATNTALKVLKCANQSCWF